MLKIGDVSIPNRVFSAPMAGVTDKAFRQIIRSCGAGLIYTEMISDLGLVYGQKRTHQLLDLQGEEHPIAVQIFGSEAEPMAQGAQLAEKQQADIIDINMGCPTPKIVKNGEGSALMLDIPRARQIIRAVVQAVRVPVTVKMRLGWSSDQLSYLQLGEAAQEEGAAAVALHARTREQFYSGQAQWEHIARLKKHLQIPVIGNGDIWTAQDAERMVQETGCDAVMIGRGIMGNPFLIREAVALLETGKQLPPPTMEEKLALAAHHLDLVCQYKGESVAVREMRKHFSWYLKGMRGAARLREKINQATTRQQLLDILQLTRVDTGTGLLSPPG
ncbi:MAG: tRNA dihydrouridine synthase DusB [Syntrophomonadaceae bacterium]|nr:tRNA dihydrouridine synthase DusB [Bacillota bacterium]NLM87721.1 tRNA dihydrouridine synthase DusB [Syntrophomonadaceae bacterium]HAA09484.1 tRNA dihydrouridine synthase DusB [Syntrophomonas sp.]